MELKLMERQAIARVFGKGYAEARKSEKGRLLDEFVLLSGLNRNYASRLLNRNPLAVSGTAIARTGRRIHYDEAVRGAVQKIWEILDYICSKRLVATLPEMIERLEYFGEMEIHRDTKGKLQKISASTIERLLAPARRKLGRKGSSMTKRGKYLIDRIPIKTFGEWTDTTPGFVQMDLVAHNGGNVFGEFINKTVLRFAEKHGMKFTRGRPYKKNDKRMWNRRILWN